MRESSLLAVQCKTGGRIASNSVDVLSSTADAAGALAVVAMREGRGVAFYRCGKGKWNLLSLSENGIS
jgi:hypothetical protein